MAKTTRQLSRCEDELHEAAMCRTGSHDFGDPGYRQGLRVLLEAFDSDLELTDTGWQAAYHSVLGALIARLHEQKGWADHPEVLAIPIDRPLVITGFPRTGTTALHRLLSMDPQFQGLEFWLSETPMIRPPREAWQTHPAYCATVANLQAFYDRLPERRKAHETVAGEVEECSAVLMQNFASGIWHIIFGLPTYSRWLAHVGERASYRRYVDVLRLIGAHEPHQRWLLKSPHHMVEIDTLLELFPAARIIQTHRDPLQAVPSACSLLHMMQRDLEGEAAQPAVIGPRKCAYLRTALDRMQAARQRSPMQFFDVDHRDLHADPLRTVHAIYDHFSLTLSPHAAQRMRAWVAASPTTRHGKHQYSVDAWGVTQTDICETFADYRAQHGYH